MIGIVVPAYNEEKNIGRVVRGLFVKGLHGLSDEITQIASEGGEWRVLVVDDGSSDGTAEIAQREGAIVVSHAVNRGQGAALQTGDEYFLTCGASLVVHFDADGQLNPLDISGAIKLMSDNKLDVVLGSRFLDKRSKLPWSKRYIILPVSRWINYLFTGLKLTDAHNGFRAMSRTALEKIKITHDGMSHNSEIVAQINKYKLKYAEYSVEVFYSEYGQGVGGGLKIFWDLIFSHL